MVDLESGIPTYLQNRSLIIVSNRGPVEYRVENGTLAASRGSGGLVTALTSLGRYLPFTWVASALSEGDVRAARESTPDSVRAAMSYGELPIRFIVSSREAYQKYYNVISNPFLWFLQHYMVDMTYQMLDHTIYDAWENGYVPVNEAFAGEVLKEAMSSPNPPVVMIQDYQLYLVGGLVRDSLPQVVIQHFIHIPWPAPRYWALLPRHMRQSILESLCSCDIVGFQTRRDAENFVATCEDLLPEAVADLNQLTVCFREHKTRARHYPISIDVTELRKMAASSNVKGYVDKILGNTSQKTIVRVDRMDPTKNILRGFRSYETLLTNYPELRGKVTFLAFLVPSRTQLSLYQNYSKIVFDTVMRINAEFGDANWEPIRVFYEENQRQAIAGMSIADVLIVNPVIDGMNLVAKEGPIVNTRNGVLVLSETVGAFDQLKEGVIPVSPVDIQGTAEAMYQALELDQGEKQRRIELIRRNIEKENIHFWLRRQLEDIEDTLTATG